MTSRDKLILRIYSVWTGLVLLISFTHEGMSANTVTRLMILAFLFSSLGFYYGTRQRTTTHRGGKDFVLACSANALVVEFCYMFSRPVFPSLLYRPGTSVLQLLHNTLIDFVFTLPAYLVIFSLFWWLIHRYQYSISQYVMLFSLGQALGDGNAFFLANPAALILIPYVMLNYQAINVIPYLRLHQALPRGRASGPAKWIAPLVLIPLTYLALGATIIVVGRAFGLAGPA